MDIAYYTQFNNEAPVKILPEDLTNIHGKKVRSVTHISGMKARLSIGFDAGYSMEIEPGPPLTVTFRLVRGRLR